MKLASFLPLVVGRRWLTMLLSMLLMLCLAAGTARIVEVDVDFRNHFNKDDPHLVDLERLEATYAISDAALVAVAPRTGTIFTREVLVAIEDLTEDLWQTPYVTRVDSLSNHTHSEGVEDELIVEPLIDDAGSLSDTDIERVQAIALGTNEVAGRFVSGDGRVSALIVSLALPEEGRQLAKVEVVDFLYGAAAEARAKHANIDYHQTGERFLNRAVRDAIDDDMGVLGPIAFGTMLLVAIVLMRSIWGTVAIVILLAAVILSGFGFAGWTGMKLYGESGAALFVLMAVTVAHAVHIMEAMQSALRQGVERKQAAIDAVELNVWPVFLTSLTTAIGFLSLNFSEMPPFRIMGNIVAFGVMCAFVYSVTLLPAFLSIVPMRPRRARAGTSGFFDRLGRFVVSRHLALLCSFAVIAVVLVAGISRIELNENQLELLDERYEYRLSTDFISENFGGLEPFEYSLDAGKEGGVTDVEYLRRVDAFAQWYRAQPEVAHVFSIADVVKRLNRNLNGDDPDFYRIPDDSDLAAQFILLYEFSLPVDLDLNNLIDVERSSTRMTVTLKHLSTGEKIALDNRAKTWLRQNAPGLATGAVGVTIVGSYSVQRNIVNMLIGTVVAMSIVSLLLILVFRSLRFGLISLIPNFVPAAMAMGLWGYVVGEVGVAASVVTAIAFGIIVDDTIHFMTKYLRARKEGRSPSESVQRAFATVGRALVTTTAVFALGFLVFSASAMAGNQVLGLLVAMTVVMALVADFLFLPPLLMALDGERAPGHRIRLRASRSSG